MSTAREHTLIALLLASPVLYILTDLLLVQQPLTQLARLLGI